MVVLAVVEFVVVVEEVVFVIALVIVIGWVVVDVSDDELVVLEVVLVLVD